VTCNRLQVVLASKLPFFSPIWLLRRLLVVLAFWLLVFVDCEQRWPSIFISLFPTRFNFL